MAMGLLVAGFDFSPVHADEFNDWYDTEHIPEREAVPGFGRIERWLGADNPRISIATYDLDTPAVLRSEAYRKIAGENLSPWSKRLTAKATRVCRFEAEQRPPACLVRRQAGSLGSVHCCSRSASRPLPQLRSAPRSGCRGLALAFPARMGPCRRRRCGILMAWVRCHRPWS